MWTPATISPIRNGMVNPEIRNPASDAGRILVFASMYLPNHAQFAACGLVFVKPSFQILVCNVANLRVYVVNEKWSR